MDWKANQWFVKHHSENISDEFKDWWISYYGKPSDYDNSYSEQQEYWVRCAFALTGWIAKP